MRNKYSFAVLVAVLFLAALTEPIASSNIGGIRVIVAVVAFFLLLGQYKRGDVPLTLAIVQMAHLNKMLIFLLTWYYLGVIAAIVREGMIYVFEWKFHASSIFALVCGLFLARNEKYKRVLVYIAMLFMLFHAVFGNRYVAVTGMDMRSALGDLHGALGHTDYWTSFGMLLVLGVGYLIEEKNKVLKVSGFLVAAYLYKTIFFCGFATPVALFLIAHIFFGLVSLKRGKKGIGRIVGRMIIACALIFIAIHAVQLLIQSEGDTRYRSIQQRFAKFVENPEGGGYTVEQSRFKLVDISNETIRKQPLFGCGGTYLDNPKTGGHHAFFDFLALYGILGGGGAFAAFVVCCLVNAYRRCRLEHNWIAFAVFAGVSMYAIVGLVNPGWMGGPMTTLLLFLHPFKMPRPKPRQMMGSPVGPHDPLRQSGAGEDLQIIR